MILIFGVPSLFLVLLIIFVGAIVGGVTTRVCPYCAERINKSATACRYCGRDVGQLRPLPDFPKLDPSYPKPSPWPLRVTVLLFGGAAIAIIYYQSAPTPIGTPAAKESRLQVAAPPMLPPAAPFVGAPIATASSPKALPKDAKPKAPAGPMRITPQ